MEFRESVRTRILEYCKHENISQDVIAEKLDLSQNTVSNWVCKKSSISGDNLRSLADLMNVSMDYLSGRTDIDPGDEARELTALFEILHFDVVNGTFTISSSLVEFLKKLQLLEQSISSGLPEEIRAAALDGLTASYKANRGSDKEFPVTYQIVNTTAPIPAPNAPPSSSNNMYLDGPYRKAALKNDPRPR